MQKKRGFGRLLLIFVGVVTIVQVAVLHHYNSLFKAQNAQTTAELRNAKRTQHSGVSTAAKARLKQLAQQHQGVTVSPSGQYATYIDTGTNGMDVVHVIDLGTGKQQSEATDLYPVETLTWLGNEEIFVGEKLGPGNLELNTFYVSNGNQANQTAASVPKFTQLSPNAEIKKVTYSAQTNDIFVLISTGTSSTVFHIGTMEHIQNVPFQGGYVKNIAMTETGANLYVEALSNGTWNVVLLKQARSASPYSPQYDVVPQVVQSNAALITVINDTLYYGKINSQGLVTSVYRENSDGTSTLLKQLSTPTLAANINVTGQGQVQVNPIATSDYSTSNS